MFFDSFWQFFTAFPICMPKSKSLRLLFAPMLFKKEQQERIALEKEWIAISLFHTQKTSDSQEKPKSKFPTLTNLQIHSFYY